MQFIHHKNKNILVYLIFFAILLIGINIYKDYGLTLDDEVYRKYGKLSYEYIKILFSNENVFSLNGLESFSEKVTGEEVISYHPILYELVLAMLTDLFNVNDTKEIFELSHFLNFLIFFISLIFFYKFIYKKFNSIFYASFSIIILFLSPRMFAEAFYNSRDIFFLSLFIFCIY